MKYPKVSAQKVGSRILWSGDVPLEELLFRSTEKIQEFPIINTPLLHHLSSLAQQSPH
jgi:hypothetical protein